MQKKTKNASILIWSIFLSVIVSISFISISSKISKNLQKNNAYVDNVTNETLKNKIINNDFESIVLENWDKLIFESDKYIKKSLKESQTYNIIFEQATNIDLYVLNWWPLSYKYFDSDNNLSLTWIVKNYKNINLNSTTWSLILNNLWWITDFYMSWSQDFVAQEKKYMIINKIWNKEFIKTSWEIKLD